MENQRVIHSLIKNDALKDMGLMPGMMARVKLINELYSDMRPTDIKLGSMVEVIINGEGVFHRLFYLESDTAILRSANHSDVGRYPELTFRKKEWDKLFVIGEIVELSEG